MSRLATGGLIDRAAPLSFTFDGRRYSGFKGDTLASALLANDVRLVGRSFKYHRPRGTLTAGAEEPNALVTLRTGARAEPNTKATTVELFEGLEAVSQNRWPSLAFDLAAVHQLAAPLLVAGFYYKTFMWPQALWEKLYEPLIRRAAGLGALSGLPDPDTYDREHAFCDVLVVGAGPAGLTAALVSARAGLRVLIADEDWRGGGRLLSEHLHVDGQPGVEWAEGALAELRSLPNVRLLTRTTVFGAYDGEYGAIERIGDHLARPAAGQPRQRLWKIVARRTILASGAVERPLVFGGNDRPGVMTASGVQTYLNRYATAPGRRAVVFTCNDSGWSCARDLMAAGVEVAAIVDPRSETPADRGAFDRQGTVLHMGAVVADVIGSPARRVEIVTAKGERLAVVADLVAISGGWDPAIGLGSNLGSRPAWSEARQIFLLEKPPAGMTLAGAARGEFGLASSLRSGWRAAVDLLAEFGLSQTPSYLPAADDEPATCRPLWRVAHSRKKAFVDFQHDVTDKDVTLAAQEGFVSVEHLKRYTTLGMATDQGKTSQVNGHALLAQATGKSIAQAGTILSRPPYQPIAIGALAGHHRDEDFRPERRAASHEWAVEMGAVFVDAGQWKRPQWFERPGLRGWLEIVNAEVTAVRNGVGICDVSSLGKIEVQGPDAGVLLDRLYINTFSTLPIGRARYGVMLREDGMVFDDGTTSRFADDHYFVTTTTANAARVMQHIDFARQALWPNLDVQATSVTEQWATYAVAGPRSRELLQRLAPDVDLSNETFPYMACREFEWRGAPARLYRLSFSGELAYEISTPAYLGDALIRALFKAGADLDVRPYGTEALGVMRIEKGHVGGGELNGQTTARDLGLGRMMAKKKDFIGRVMAAREGLTAPERPSLVGLKLVDGRSRVRSGAHLLSAGAPQVAANVQGYVTSAAFSPTVGHPIALGLLSHGSERLGEIVVAHDPVRDGDVEAEVCSPVFVDPGGERLRA